MVYRLEHVGLGTSQETYEQTVSFYETVFGWHRIRELAGELTFLGDGHGGRFEIFPSSSEIRSNPTHLAFAVPAAEFDAVLRRAGLGGATLDEPYVNEFDDRIGYFTDPAGNRAQVVARSAALAE
jgi:predicted enzyme related to lactoylglutathione lyase